MIPKRLLSVDPSLTCSGWALFALDGGQLLGVGKIRSLNASVALANRMADLQDKITALFERFAISGNDVLICEAQTTMRDPGAAFKVEQVRGIFETVARANSVQVPGRLNPRSVQNELMGLKGKQVNRSVVKQTAVGVVRTLYGKTLAQMGFNTECEELKRHQDIVDALLIGTLGLARINSAEMSGTALEDFFQGSNKRSRMTK